MLDLRGRHEDLACGFVEVYKSFDEWLIFSLGHYRRETALQGGRVTHRPTTCGPAEPQPPHL